MLGGILQLAVDEKFLCQVWAIVIIHIDYHPDDFNDDFLLLTDTKPHLPWWKQAGAYSKRFYNCVNIELSNSLKRKNFLVHAKV